MWRGAQWLRALAVLPEDLVSTPITTWWLTTVCLGDLIPKYRQTKHQ